MKSYRTEPNVYTSLRSLVSGTGHRMEMFEEGKGTGESTPHGRFSGPKAQYRILRFAAGMVEPALRAKQFAFAALEQGPAIDTILPIVECIGWAGIGFHGAAWNLFILILHRQKYGRCVPLSREETPIFSPSQPEKRDAHRLHSPDHIERFFLRRPRRRIEGRVIVG